MAWFGIRVGVSKVLPPLPRATTASKALLQINLKVPCPIHAACISGSALRDKSKVRPAPFPYKTKSYNFWRAWLQDTTTDRFDENTKIVVVEGPIAAGKTAFAKSLAEDLDMLHMPEVTMDDFYINSYGYDMRKLDPQLPVGARSYDEKNFCTEPNHENTANFQIMKYKLRYSQYIDALAHLMNTGQGVVLERCAYSDFVFMETMHNAGYISKGARDVYYDIYKNTIGELMKPHLVIYLDVPVPLVQQRIKERKIPYEISSKVFTKQYLSDMEYFYKQRYLKEIGSHAELLIYDWSSYGDVEVVVEDIERIDFDNFDKYDPKMKDWRLTNEWDWNTARIRYTSEKDDLLTLFMIPRLDVPELVLNAHDVHKLNQVWWNAPGMKYDKEFNTDMGDTNLLFKTKKQDYRSTTA
ncbi:NADH dehydrogenase [ubiquinone] 1 alpha subcomplex subunit 10, mitochondrial [Cryptotermes secundus]|uniref:NADH dehydrogenase [ubiquinone] 1 alpha subcomplex subunit 10, mitochondrial n=2 Tax=Cryptotermes secundus TaxID=105785 RepID=A0A2J7QKF4_9NEOP|nr:NADH dehydrogenase [ubiquinone] 1 alpha subcomplex subunit 10, mitochondrial isoform X1 [Cryptotermes secundus]XP_023712093.1 NADH dehydrogenase [ubiquinone] 1 alpha subcomplex subunit 10, mitochondrial isoform X1 [Cryptotermes secundus]PNF29067.1 NADH dehydrogenase [ubiquinone] 1 alpha subcomplex subunit 10, mitochondrial [Cryptotermes secundus]PNF29068.1 NADH dehydrogenase [ubiquinone] 1 alpha subcomplex subunit 10, mitochondrial [Cryptotermes secundus]